MVQKHKLKRQWLAGVTHKENTQMREMWMQFNASYLKRRLKVTLQDTLKKQQYIKQYKSTNINMEVCVIVFRVINFRELYSSTVSQRYVSEILERSRWAMQ